MTVITIDGVSREGTPEGDTFEVVSGKNLLVDGLTGVDSLTVRLSGNVEVYNNIYTGERQIGGETSSITGTFKSFEDTKLLFDGGASIVRLLGRQGTYPLLLDGGAGYRAGMDR